MDYDRNLKKKVLEEIKLKVGKTGIYDKSLECLRNLPPQRRRQLIFELASEGLIELNNTKQIDDPDFPLLITGCSK
jgi:hypothetical protein